MRSRSPRWASWPWRRCRAVREPGHDDGYYGRCDLEPHGPDVDHALERGAETWRWSTAATHVHVFEDITRSHRGVA